MASSAYPRLVVNRQALAQNVRMVTGLCAQYGVGLTGVTKVFCGDPSVARVLADNGVARLGDSRVANLRRMENIHAEKWLIRPPMPSEAAETVRFADVSLNSEMETMRALGFAAKQQERTHGIILMADLGDIREGYTDYKRLVQDAIAADALPGLTVCGVGVNLTCFSFVQPDDAKMRQLAAIAQDVEHALGRALQVVSGGNSATLNLLRDGGVCAGVNNLRLGEALLFGKERASYTYLPGTRNDVFTLECEVVECKCKPSLPWGTIGVDSYGNRPTFADRGERMKAICALGKQDFDPETTTPMDEGVMLLGASSDHLMLDVTDSPRVYRSGDIVRLKLGYYSTLRAFTSSYVNRQYR